MAEPLAPDKRLGQHFLRDERALACIADLAAEIEPQAIVEVGPGPGDLTAALLQRAGAARVFAVEIDDRWVRHLRARFGSCLTCVHADAAQVDWRPWLAAHDRIAVVGNLPYNASMPIYFGLLHARVPHPFARLVLMFQREVAERIVARPGSRRYGIPSVLTTLYAQASIALRLRPGAFWPPPKVHSAVVRADVAPEVRLDAGGDVAGFERFVRTAFGRRRKTLRNALAAGGWSRERIEAALAAAGVQPMARAEALAPAQLAAIWRYLKR